ncbi:site-specific integrase [Actinopolymorpha sp. B17G11]|uniref:site-specific integrase n=1 Tax=unclassified Actinopolymorpha TaxID=2627063 RepID=UPI0032D96FBC
MEEAFKRDPDWGAFVWVAMTVGARRGELCALRWTDVGLTNGVLSLRRALHVDNGEVTEKDTKTHQQRRIVLDAETVEVLREHLQRCKARAAALEFDWSDDPYVFSLDPDNGTPLLPDSVTQRYERLAKRLGIETTLHKLRHYSATELIMAGVDVRTVAGRLGHGGGGATTLRVYAAWTSEADQRAAAALSARMPRRPQGKRNSMS